MSVPSFKFLLFFPSYADVLRKQAQESDALREACIAETGWWLFVIFLYKIALPTLYTNEIHACVLVTQLEEMKACCEREMNALIKKTHACCEDEMYRLIKNIHAILQLEFQDSKVVNEVKHRLTP